MTVNSKIYHSAKIWHPEPVNIYNSEIGENTKIASFVEIGGSPRARIENNFKIEGFSFLPLGTLIEDYVFVSPLAIITNDRYPIAKNETSKLEPVMVKHGASFGAGSVISGDVPSGTIVYGEKASAHRPV